MGLVNRLAVLTLITFALVGFATPATTAANGDSLAQDQLISWTSTRMPPTAPTDSPESTLTVGVTNACGLSADGPQLQQARLYASRETITSKQPGRIAGSIALDIQSECDVVVQITLSIPSGLILVGGTGLSSSGPGTATSTFKVQPGEVKSLVADVYANSLGEKTVTADITYYPEGHKDEAREIDGLILTIDAQNTITPPPTETPGPLPIGMIQIGLLLLVGVGMLMVLVRRGSPEDRP